MKASRSRLPETGTTETRPPAKRAGPGRSVWASMLGDDALSSADSFELLQRLLDLFVGVRGHAARPEDGLPHIDRGVDGGVGVDALLEQGLPEHHGRVLVANVDRHDRSLRIADVEPQGLQALSPHAPPCP